MAGAEHRPVHADPRRLGSRRARGRHAPGKALVPGDRCRRRNGSRRRGRGHCAACSNARLKEPAARLGRLDRRRHRTRVAAGAHARHLARNPTETSDEPRIRSHRRPHRRGQVGPAALDERGRPTRRSSLQPALPRVLEGGGRAVSRAEQARRLLRRLLRDWHGSRVPDLALRHEPTARTLRRSDRRPRPSAPLPRGLRCCRS